jgi:hypothetical protein
MRLESEAKLVAGILALVGMLALSSPGVRVARAGNGDPGTSEPAPSAIASGQEAGVCSVDNPNPSRAEGSSAPTAEQIAARIRMEMMSSGEKPIVLNGRGYNYRVARDPQRELELLRAEALRQQEQAASGH